MASIVAGENEISRYRSKWDDWFLVISFKLRFKKHPQLFNTKLNDVLSSDSVVGMPLLFVSEGSCVRSTLTKIRWVQWSIGAESVIPAEKKWNFD